MSLTLSARELNFLGQVWQSFKSDPDVDMDKLFTMADYKTKASTNTAYHRLKAKILAAGSAAEDGEADIEDSGAPSPAAKKGRGKKAAPVKTEDSEDEDDEAEQAVPAKLTASGRPSRAAGPKPAASKSARAARPVVVRATRASARANKLDVQISEDSDEDTIKPVGKGRAVKRDYTSEEDWNTMSSMIQQAAGISPTPDPEHAPAPDPAHGTKRAATETPSDVEDFDVKRIKGENDDEDNDNEVETPAASDAASFGDTVPSDTEVDMTADLTQVTDVEELAPVVHEI